MWVSECVYVREGDGGAENEREGRQHNTEDEATECMQYKEREGAVLLLFIILYKQWSFDWDHTVHI